MSLRNIIRHSLILVLLWCVASLDAQEVRHHWTFVEGDGFITDSVGAVALEVDGAAVRSSPLPSSELDRGTEFSRRLSSPNESAALFESDVGGLQGRIAPIEGDFTVELLANISELGSPGSNLVTQATPTLSLSSGWQSEFGWALHVRGDGSFSSFDRELVLGWSDGNQFSMVKSGLVVEVDTDYHIAAAVSAESQRATFSLHDLTTGELQISPIPVGSVLNSHEWLLIGDLPSWGADYNTTGLLDEVRLSSGLLEVDEMLVQSTPSTVVLSPYDIYQARDGRSRKTSLLGSSLSRTNPNEQVYAKFDLPDHLGPSQVKAAKLRVFIDDVSAPDSSELSLSVAQADNGNEMLDFGDELFVDSGISLFNSGDSFGDYVDIDVTDFVRADYELDGDSILSSFRIDVAGDQFRLSMPRTLGQQPQLIVSLSDLTSVEFDCDGNGTLDFADLACVETVDGRDAVLAEADLPLGDIDGDGAVAFNDFLVMVDNFGSDDGSYLSGNLDLADGVRFPDFLLLAENFGAGGQAVVPVPEPRASILSTLGIVMWTVRRRPMRVSVEPSR